MYSLLTPDKHVLFLNMYHFSNKMLLPYVTASTTCYFLGDRIPLHTITCNTTHTITLANIAYHSYVSCSCVISDYIKQPKLETVSRLVNIKSHGIAFLGFLGFFWNHDYLN